MPRSRKIRRRPSTPNLKLAHHFHHHQQDDYQHAHTADPASPPETPTTSPPVSRKKSLKPRHQPDFNDMFHPPLSSDPNIRPVGTGHQFSYQPTLGPEQLSPRSSSSSDTPDDSSDDDCSEGASMASLPNAPDAPDAVMSVENDEDEAEDELSDVEESDSDSSDNSSSSDASEASEEQEVSHLTTTTTSVPCNFEIEDIDIMDSECEGLDIVHPTEIESNRSRSRSRHSRHKDLDSGVMHEFEKLHCSNETSDNEISPEASPEASPEGDLDFDEEAFLRRREQLRKLRRMSMGSSFGKRTHSELSDSDNDDEALDANDVGSSARRMRRKLHRTSLLFHDPPPARIDELEEPDSSEDERVPGQDLARELPYWAMEIMEMSDSS